MQGLLLLNLGTPADLSLRAVRAYLREFLSDPDVIDLPNPWRWLLVNCLIVPFRSPKSLAAYKEIWQADGSPLLVNSQRVAELMQRDYPGKVALAMRYGKPDIAEVLSQLKSCSEITVLPMFPQFAQATTGSVFKKLQQELKKINYSRPVHWIKDYCVSEPFITAWASSIAPVWKQASTQSSAPHLLLSFHGLPWRQLRTNPACGKCSDAIYCPSLNAANKDCYRAQCFATARAIAEKLGLQDAQWSISFQSRLGRIPWIGPYTEQHIKSLQRRKIDDLVVACPSFAVDCLETLEEIKLRLAESWVKLTGKNFRFVSLDCARLSSAYLQMLS